MKSAGSIEVQGFLIQGTHDALIELRNAHGPRHGNHLALHAAEILLQKYPMLLSDLQHSVSPENRVAGDKASLVKIKFRRSTYPLLSGWHASLAWGVQGVAMINLLNRLYMIAEAAPEEVEELMQKRRMKQMGQTPSVLSSDHGSTQVGGGADITGLAGASSTAAGENIEAVQEPEITEIILRDVEGSPGMPAEVSVLTSADDPLNDLSFGPMF